MITHAASRKQYTVLLDRPELSTFTKVYQICYINFFDHTRHILLDFQDLVLVQDLV